jgi:hypothetical protein
MIAFKEWLKWQSVCLASPEFKFQYSQKKYFKNKNKELGKETGLLEDRGGEVTSVYYLLFILNFGKFHVH